MQVIESNLLNKVGNYASIKIQINWKFDEKEGSTLKLPSHKIITNLQRIALLWRRLTDTTYSVIIPTEKRCTKITNSRQNAVRTQHHFSNIPAKDA